MFNPSIVTMFRNISRVVHALILRELKARFGKMKLGYLWAFLEPLMFIGFFYVLWSFIDLVPAGLPLFPFLLTGFGTFMFFFKIMPFSMMAVRVNRPLLTFPQVSPFCLVLARTILEFATLSVVYVMLLGVCSALGYPVDIADPLRLIIVILMMSLIGSGMGFFFSTLTPLYPSLDQLLGTAILRPAFFASGNFFSAGMMPEGMRDWLLLNPLLHGTELARSAYFAEFESSHGSMQFLAGCAFGIFFLGLLTQRALRSHLYRNL